MRAIPNNVYQAFMLGRCKLSMSNPYLSAAVYRLTVAYDERCPTASVADNWVLYLGPESAKLKASQMAFLIRHEVWHLLRRHGDRCRAIGAIPRVWNYCADAEINDDPADGLEMPQFLYQGTDPKYKGKMMDGVLPKNLGCDNGLIAEEYYAKIQDKIQFIGVVGEDGSVPAGSGSDGSRKEWEEDGGPGTTLGKDAPSDTEVTAIIRSVASAILGGGIGTGHAGLLRWAKGVTKPSITPWQKLLTVACQRGVRIGGQMDYTFSRPGRRWRPDMIRPAMYSNMPHVATIFDSSGSMQTPDFEAAVSEAAKIMKTIGGTHAISNDTEVHDMGMVYDISKIKIVGGGGTDMRVPIQYCCALKNRPSIIVVITDGDSPWEMDPPNVKTYVVLTRPTGTSIPSWATVLKAYKERET